MDGGPDQISPNCSSHESNHAGSLKRSQQPWQAKSDGRNGLQKKSAEKNQRVGSSNTNEERCLDGQEPHESTSVTAAGDTSPVQVLAEINANSHFRQNAMEVDEACESASSGHRQGPSVDGAVAVEHDIEETIARPTVHPALRRWQSKQLAQGIIDNSINKVLGDLSLPPFQNEGPPGWGNYLNPLNIENEGVVEAIRQQGLQRRYSQRPSAPASPPPPDATYHKRLRLSKEQDGASTSTSDCHVDSANPVVETVLAAHSSSGFASEAELALHKPKGDTGHPSTEIVPNETSLTVSDAILMPPEELLDTAISCAITHKGLGVLPVNE